MRPVYWVLIVGAFIVGPGFVELAWSIPEGNWPSNEILRMPLEARVTTATLLPVLVPAWLITIGLALLLEHSRRPRVADVQE